MKRCGTCGLEKPLEEFHRKASRPDGRQSVCRTCKKEYNRRYYIGNAERHRDMRARHRARLRTRVAELLESAKDVPCADCGGIFPTEAMDFDHVRGRKRVDATGMRKLGFQTAVEEIAKCEVVCVNCHRRRTRWRRRRRDLLEQTGWLLGHGRG